MNKGLISVIVPVYNTEKYLPRCIESIIKQTYQNIEIILVDNRSTDDSGKICDDYAEIDNRISVIHRREHGWICDGRNDGLKIANGQWISFVDSDDWIDDDMYEIMIMGLSDNVDVLCCEGCICEYEGGDSKHAYTSAGNFVADCRDQIVELIRHIFIPVKHERSTSYNMSAPWDKLYNADFLRKNNIFFDEKVLFADDSYFNVQVFSCAKKIVGVSYIGYHYRQNSASVTHRYRPDWPPKICTYLQMLRELLISYDIYDQLKDAYRFTALRCFLNILRGAYLNKECHVKSKIIRAEIDELKKSSVFQDAIYEKSNSGLSGKLVVFKFALRQSHIWPLRIIIEVEKLCMKIKRFC